MGGSIWNPTVWVRAGAGQAPSEIVKTKHVQLVPSIDEQGALECKSGKVVDQWSIHGPELFHERTSINTSSEVLCIGKKMADRWVIRKSPRGHQALCVNTRCLTRAEETTLKCIRRSAGWQGPLSEPAQKRRYTALDHIGCHHTSVCRSGQQKASMIRIIILFIKQFSKMHRKDTVLEEILRAWRITHELGFDFVTNLLLKKRSLHTDLDVKRKERKSLPRVDICQI